MSYATNYAACVQEWKKFQSKYPTELEGWRWGVTKRSKSRYGCCKYRRRLIEISSWHIDQNPEWAVIDTFRHEVAHILAGPGAKHGHTWKIWAQRCEATPKACSKGGELLNQKNDHRWHLICATHGVVGRYKNCPSVRKVWTSVCAKCRAKLTIQYNSKQTETVNVPAPSHFVPTRTPEIRLPIAAEATSPRRSTGKKLYAYGCVAPDGIRCTNNLGARERRMGLTFTKLPSLMTKDQALVWLRRGL